MGIGSFPAGYGPAGIDPHVPGVARVPAVPRTAFLIDGATRDYMLDADGRYIPTHPVDAAVFDALRIVLGSVLSAPDVGDATNLLTHINRSRIQAQVEDRVTTALASLVARKVVQVLSIEIDLRVPTRLLRAVRYRNLVTGQTHTASPS
jgi:hypothetical protein